MADAVDATGRDRGGGGDPFVGRLLADRYRVDARLGGGAMGALYRAHDTTLDRAVALKVVHPHLTADPNVAQRFDREALAASKLDHPNCVRVLDAGSTPEGIKYIVMQLLEGRELRDILRAGPLTPTRAVDLAMQILRGLDHAHRRGLVHRDLKPENVFVVLDDEGRETVKLVDFGIVKLLGEDQQKLTRAGMVFGTPRYMSPEQVAGGTIDARTDLYAVGVVMHEMLTGVPPFDGDSPGIIMHMHVLADVPPLPATVPGEVRDIVLRLMQKSPGDRWPDARAVIEALEASRRPAAAVVTPRVTTAPRLPPPPVLAPSPPPAAVPPPRVAAIARAPAPAPGPPPAAVVPAPAAPVAPPPQRRVLPVPDVPHRAGAPARVVIRRARWRAIVGLVVLLLVPLLGVAIGIMLWSVLGGRPESPQMREDGSPEDRR